MSLIKLCKYGVLEGVKAALQRGDDVNTKDEYGQTGLMKAVIYTQYNSVVDLLLNTPNIDVNQKDNKGRCALHLAFTWENIEAVKLLLNAPNIDVNILDNNGASAVHLAVYKENVYDYDWTVHRDAQCTGHSIEGLKLLLSHPSLTSLTLNMKGRGHYGYTPVMWAVVWNRLKHVEVLVADPRVDLDTTDNEGKSLEEVARNPETRKVVAEAKQRREEKRRLIRKQQRQVSKVLLDGLYDPDSPISKLLGVRMEVVGEIIWQKMLVESWQIYPGQ